MKTSIAIYIGLAGAGLLGAGFALFQPRKPVPDISANPVMVPPRKQVQARNPPIVNSSASMRYEQELAPILRGEYPNDPRRAVEEFQAQHPGKSLQELAHEASLTPTITRMLSRLSENPEHLRALTKAMAFATRMKDAGSKSRQSLHLSLSHLPLNEAQAERYLGAVLTEDVSTFSKVLTDVTNETATIMALGAGEEDGKPPLDTRRSVSPRESR